MISQAQLDEIADRVAAARRLRCGGDAFVLPPSDWPRIIAEAWPAIWHLPPWSIAVGLVDLTMAMSAHLAELDPEARIVDACMDYWSGGLHMRASFRVDAIRDVVAGYEYLARNLCSECGVPGDVREIVIGTLRVVQIRCEHHHGGTR